MDTRLHSVMPNMAYTAACGNNRRSAAISGPVRAAPVLVNMRTGGAGRASRAARRTSMSPSDGTIGTTVTPYRCMVLISPTCALGSVSTSSAPARMDRNTWYRP